MASGNMSWWWRWVQMLAMLAACRLRFGAAEEGDPLPAALVELVRSSPIASIEDLQLLLFSDSVDGEEEGSPANEGHRLPRSLDAQPAQQALCKVRTEVVEVTRAMLDRSNANFLLWPPCVEVQRCSGCCNTKSLQCVPVLTHTRYLQVMKIQYVNKRPTYAKAVVSVVDHVECRCQPAPRPPAPRKKSTRRQQTHGKETHRNQTLSQASQGKSRSKENLHQQDELKDHQRAQLEELLERHSWSNRGDTFTTAAGHEEDEEEDGEGYSLASRSRENVLRGEGPPPHPPHWVYNATRLLGTATTGADNRTLFEVEEDANGTNGRPRTELRPRKDAATGSPTTTKATTGGTRFRPTKEPNPDPRPRHEDRRKVDNETPEEEEGEERRRSQQQQTDEEERLAQEKRELLLLHRRLDQERMELLHRQQQQQREEEEARARDPPADRERGGERPQTTTQKTETLTTTTTRPVVAPAAPRPPARPNPPRKRMRKNRKRISKAAMRAMLM